MLSTIPCSGFLYLQFLARCHPYILFQIFNLVLYCMCMQVFLDEVNTSSCLGLFKEIILDRTFDGEVQYMYHNVQCVYTCMYIHM